MAQPTTVRSELVLTLVVPEATTVPVRSSLSYDARDPYAVTVAFHTGAASTAGVPDVVEWTFARQLLTDGVHGPVGEGDVQVWPSASANVTAVSLSLSSPSGRARFEIPLSELVEFLALTYVAVPTGSEGDHVDLDAELALLLWAEPET